MLINCLLWNTYILYDFWCAVFFYLLKASFLVRWYLLTELLTEKLLLRATQAGYAIWLSICLEMSVRSLKAISNSFKLVVRGHFNPWLFNPILFNHELFNPMVQKFKVEKFMIEKSGVEKSGFEKSGVENFMVEKSGVGKFMVEKSGIEMSGVEAWGWKVRG